MTRIDDEALSLHLEVALSGTAPGLLTGLAAPDYRQRHAAAADIAWYLTERLRCFDIRFDEVSRLGQDHPSLFPEDQC